MKRCSRCGSVKPELEFSKASREKDGLQCWCKVCSSKQRKPGLNKSEVRKSICLHCGEEFVLLSTKRLYCSNKCRSLFNNTSEVRYDWKDNNPERSILYRSKASAKKKNIPFNLDLSDIKIPKVCPVLGIELLKGKDNSCDNSPSIDKIKPELGYVKGNVRIISQRANLLKSNATIDELEAVLNDLKSKTTIITEASI
jgi:hypothetical protein